MNKAKRDHERSEVKRFYKLVVCIAFLLTVIAGCEAKRSPDEYRGGEEKPNMGNQQPAGEKIVTTATGLQSPSSSSDATQIPSALLNSTVAARDGPGFVGVPAL